MARPIIDTPTLYGDDAIRFLERIGEEHKASKEEKDRIRRSFEMVSQWFKNGDEYDTQQSNVNKN